MQILHLHQSILFLIEKHDSGMWKGELNGKIGLFPYNFVAEVQNESQASAVPQPMEGWLTKQGHVMKNWKKRWFSLRGKELFYYEKQNSPKEKGSIPLDGCIVSNGEDKSDRPFCFHISYPNSPGRKDFFVCAEDTWVSAIIQSSKS
ncbi:MAG: hypothetical protein EZS28_028718 [Streblomastix strix]|uniref:PH domain-containing protein n=1 Tax=Streblomastix strix TaxID=222440 RepID=A0A5J4UZI0_9EUKA|nr:MAG: hypothetical protein EZS28_028718 [Streblomastix strix]